jgi:predicted dehydrogenase
VHYLDIVMYCCGDPVPKTVSGQAFCKLGKDIDNYVYTDMWAGPHIPGGVYDVDDSVTALIRTEGPVITVNGAWAQNIGVRESFIDFMGDRAGIRLQYGGNYTLYTAKDGMLQTITPAFQTSDMFQREIDEFVDCVKTGKKLASHIDTVIITAQIMQAIYDSSDQNKEISFS